VDRCVSGPFQSKIMKSKIQGLLRSLGLHERLQASVVYDLYWLVANPDLIRRRREEMRFYNTLLADRKRGALVFDVGANCGGKTDIFLRLGAKVVAVEPDNFNQNVLKRKFYSYRLWKKPVTIVDKALSDRNSVGTMWIDSPGSALNTLSDKWASTLRSDSDRFGSVLTFKEQRQVQITTLEDLFDIYGVPCFVKIDVEGFEINVLRGMKRPVPLLSFEVNLPEFRNEGIDCIELLQGIDPGGSFNYASSCQKGLELKQWLPRPEFLPVFLKCDHTVEVFWKSPGALSQQNGLSKE